MTITGPSRAVYSAGGYFYVNVKATLVDENELRKSGLHLASGPFTLKRAEVITFSTADFIAATSRWA